MNYVIEFLIVFILVYLYYRLLVMKKGKKKTKALPIEVRFFIDYCKIDITKVSEESLIKKISFLNAFDIAAIIVILEFIDSLYLQIISGIALIFLFILLSYKILGVYYKKKGMMKNV